jgi:hypothetical protein
MSTLPQSTALAEASPENLSDLLSRDPEGYTRQDRLRVIEALRAQRARWEASEGKPKGAKAEATSLITNRKVEDLF